MGEWGGEREEWVGGVGKERLVRGGGEKEESN